jgi:cytochrome c oxidase subunit 4
MSDSTLEAESAPVDAEGHDHDAHDGDHAHPSDMLYIKIAGVLAVLTALEVSWPFIVDDGPILMWPLLIMMAIKFVLIGSFFMHLKFDSKLLTRVFYSGLALAVGVYIIALLTFRLFEGQV